jgi:hypothetical protein
MAHILDFFINKSFVVNASLLGLILEADVTASHCYRCNFKMVDMGLLFFTSNIWIHCSCR